MFVLSHYHLWVFEERAEVTVRWTWTLQARTIVSYNLQFLRNYCLFRGFDAVVLWDFSVDFVIFGLPKWDPAFYHHSLAFSRAEFLELNFFPSTVALAWYKTPPGRNSHYFKYKAMPWREHCYTRTIHLCSLFSFPLHTKFPLFGPLDLITALPPLQSLQSESPNGIIPSDLLRSRGQLPFPNRPKQRAVNIWKIHIFFCFSAYTSFT